MSNRVLEDLQRLSNAELRLLIREIIEKDEELAGMRNYLSITRERRRGRVGNIYRIYNFIDREEMCFYSEKEASLQFLRLLDDAGYLKGALAS